ncbi:MAG: hypothetical protein KAH38_10190 [Candidatus Hydrogenedentes bacterium]|nr:hypothetical protein [Candidatus Hydrogenedentota bacterium]
MLVSVLILGCTTSDNSAYVRDDVQYGITAGTFRGRWWSYYERGTSFLNGDYFEEAISDFETALIGRKKDSWQARTYGLHFTQYFPNRELGVAYYQMERYEEAAALLDQAVEMVDTARGHHYLGLARRSLIAKGVIEDLDAPGITDDLEEGVLLTDHVLPIKIAASDDLGVAEVRLNDKVLPQRAERTKVEFQEQVKLKEGVNEIEVVVTDLANKVQTEKHSFILDMTGPTIGLFTPTDAAVLETSTVSVEGVCLDNHGMAEIIINGKKVASGNGQMQLAFSSEIPIKAGENKIRMMARDMAGNETCSQILVYQGNLNDVAAHAWLLQQRDPASLMFAQKTGRFTLAAVPEAGDKILLKSPRSDKPNRHNRAVRVSGEVTASSGVSELSINGQPFDQLTGAPKEVFSRRIPIEDEKLLETGGHMKVSVVAKDKDGKTLKEEVEVELRPVTLNTIESRMPIAVLAFEGHETSDSLSEQMRLTLEEQLLLRKRFRTLDRVQLQAVLTEQELAAALSNPAEAIQLGRVTPAHVLLIGDVFQHGDGVEIKVRIISSETSDVIAIIDGYAKENNLEGFKAACESLATQLEKIYPRMSGELLVVRERRGKTDLYFDWTSDDGLQPGAYALIVYEEPAEYDEVLGEYFGPFITEVGRVRFEEISKKNSRARSVEILTEDIKLEQGMAAITM